MNENNIPVNDDSQGRLYIYGTRGYSAYEIALRNGFVGTEQEWLDSLVGPIGEQGVDGKSAYDVAVENGYIGTEEEWVNDFLSPDGYYNKDEIDAIELEQNIKINKKAYYFDTVADMKNSTTLINGSFVKTLGYRNSGDGGESIYKIRNINNDDIIDEKRIIEITGDTTHTLIAEFIDTNIIYPEQFGAYGDNNHDDTLAIQYAIDNYEEIHLRNSTYIVKGVTIKSKNRLIGENSTFKGDYTTNGIMCYSNDANEMMTYVYLKGITLKNYLVGLYTVNCTRSIFININCNYNRTGSIFAGKTWINKLYNCRFDNNTYNGLDIAKESLHPITQSNLTLNTYTFDFYSCEFAGNGGYGVSGWMRNFSFFGGNSELNGEGAVHILSVNDNGATRISYEVSFFGFDVEQVNKGYIIEGTQQVEIWGLNIIGGQISTDGNFDTFKSALVFKGPTCTINGVYDVYVKCRLTQNTTDRYGLYADGSTRATAQIDIGFGNRNGGYINTNNFLYIIPNDLNRLSGEMPLEQIGGEYYNLTTHNIELPVGACLKLPFDNLCLTTSIKFTTLASGDSIKVLVSGTKINNYIDTHNRTLQTDANNQVLFNMGVVGNNVVVRNVGNSTISITNLEYNGFTHR